jgi:hypothetical protein
VQLCWALWSSPYGLTFNQTSGGEGEGVGEGSARISGPAPYRSSYRDFRVSLPHINFSSDEETLLLAFLSFLSLIHRQLLQDVQAGRPWPDEYTPALPEPLAD